MKDRQPTPMLGLFPVGGRLFWCSGWHRCAPICAQMGILHAIGIVCPRKRQKQVFIVN
jgi:hypothetical protein